jgi:hypothetical protein
VLVAILAITLILAAAAAGVVRAIARLRATVARLEKRIGVLELDSVPTLVVEPDPSTPPATRPRNALVN